MEGIKSRLDTVETINEIEIRDMEEKYKEAEAQRLEEYLENCVTNTNGTIFDYRGTRRKR